MNKKYIPNVITILRVLLIPLLLWAIWVAHYRLGFVLLVITGCSDGFDGFLARQYGWTSRFGAIADPLADKLLLMSSFIVLALKGHIPYWLLWPVLFRDIWIMTGVLFYHFLIGTPDFTPSFISKLNTVLQILLIVLLLFSLGFWTLSPWLLESLYYMVLATTLLSLFNYTWVWGRRAYFKRFARGMLAHGE